MGQFVQAGGESQYRLPLQLGEHRCQEWKIGTFPGKCTIVLEVGGSRKARLDIDQVVIHPRIEVSSTPKVPFLLSFDFSKLSFQECFKPQFFHHTTASHRYGLPTENTCIVLHVRVCVAQNKKKFTVSEPSVGDIPSFTLKLIGQCRPRHPPQFPTMQTGLLPSNMAAAHPTWLLYNMLSPN